MNLLLIISIVAGILGSIVACLLAGHNFFKGWKERMVTEEEEKRIVKDLATRVKAIEDHLWPHS